MIDVCIFIIIFIEYVLFIMYGLILFGSMIECLFVYERIILLYFCFILMIFFIIYIIIIILYNILCNNSYKRFK